MLVVMLFGYAAIGTFATTSIFGKVGMPHKLKIKSHMYFPVVTNPSACPSALTMMIYNIAMIASQWVSWMEVVLSVPLGADQLIFPYPGT